MHRRAGIDRAFFNNNHIFTTRKIGVTRKGSKYLFGYIDVYGFIGVPVLHHYRLYGVSCPTVKGMIGNNHCTATQKRDTNSAKSFVQKFNAAVETGLSDTAHSAGTIGNNIKYNGKFFINAEVVFECGHQVLSAYY